jgi:hypothetical protein
MTLGSNPQQIQNLLLQQNPQLKVLLTQMKQSNLSPIQFVMQYARQNNIQVDENSLLTMCQQMQGMTPKQ